MHVQRQTNLGLLLLIAPAAVLLSACAKEGSSGPYAKPLPVGETCRSIQHKLKTMDSQGVPAKVEAVAAGRKVSKSSRAQAALYNKLLNDYLGARCHAVH